MQHYNSKSVYFHVLFDLWMQSRAFFLQSMFLTAHPSQFKVLIIFCFCSIESGFCIKIKDIISDFINFNTSRVNPPGNPDSCSAIRKMLGGQFGNGSNGFHSMIWKVWWIFTYVKLCNLKKNLLSLKNPLRLFMHDFMVFVSLINPGVGWVVWF